MRVRGIVLGVALVAALTACSGGDGDGDGEPGAAPEPTESLTEVVVDCPEFADTAQRVADAQQALYARGGSGADAVDDLVAELEALEVGAPADVRAALGDLAEGFQAAQRLLEDPTPEQQAELAEVSAELAAAGERVTAYITEQCG